MRLLVQRPAAVRVDQGRTEGRLGVKALDLPVATLKKLSARRKNPCRGRWSAHQANGLMTETPANARGELNEFIVPPSALKPDATASASRMVDFPDRSLR